MKFSLLSIQGVQQTINLCVGADSDPETVQTVIFRPRYLFKNHVPHEDLLRLQILINRPMLTGGMRDPYKVSLTVDNGKPALFQLDRQSVSSLANASGILVHPVLIDNRRRCRGQS